MTDTVVPAPLPQFATYTVPVAWLTDTSAGYSGRFMTSGVRPQPAVRWALQVAPLMTETVLLFELTT